MSTYDIGEGQPLSEHEFRVQIATLPLLPTQKHDDVSQLIADRVERCSGVTQLNRSKKGRIEERQALGIVEHRHTLAITKHMD